jgi:hypothetical protein
MGFAIPILQVIFRLSGGQAGALSAFRFSLCAFALISSFAVFRPSLALFALISSVVVEVREVHAQEVVEELVGDVVDLFGEEAAGCFFVRLHLTEQGGELLARHAEAAGGVGESLQRLAAGLVLLGGAFGTPRLVHASPPPVR